MKLEYFDTFLSVAKYGKIRKASAHLKLTQPAVSTRISILERELGVQLFERKKHGLVLTSEGVLFHMHAEKIQNQIMQLKYELTPTKEVKGIVRIGVAETIAHAWLPIFLAKINQIYPKLAIDLNVDISINLKDQLIKNDLDLIISMESISENNINSIILPSFKLGWFFGANTSNCDLINNPIISFPRSSPPYKELISELMERYSNPGRVFSSTTLSTSIEMIAAGIGVGILPLIIASPIVKQGRIYPFDPGWCLSDLQFMISYDTFPRNKLIKDIANIASIVAKNFENDD